MPDPEGTRFDVLWPIIGHEAVDMAQQHLEDVAVDHHPRERRILGTFKDILQRRARLWFTRLKCLFGHGQVCGNLLDWLAFLSKYHRGTTAHLIQIHKARPSRANAAMPINAKRTPKDSSALFQLHPTLCWRQRGRHGCFVILVLSFIKPMEAHNVNQAGTSGRAHGNP